MMRSKTRYGLTLLSVAWASSPLLAGEAARSPAPTRPAQQRASTTSHDSAAAAWERMLNDDQTAQMEYRDLLTHFCQAERERNPSFPCVEATEEEYYLACPPDAAIMEFARHELPRDTQPPGFALKRVLDQWWPHYGAKGADRGSPRSDQSSGVWSMSPTERRAMWRIPQDGAPGISLGLIPVAIQPPGDRTEGSAYISSEHGRRPPVRSEPTRQVGNNSVPPPVPAQESMTRHEPPPPPPAYVAEPAKVYYQPPPPPPPPAPEPRYYEEDDDDDDDGDHRDADDDDDDDD